VRRLRGETSLKAFDFKKCPSYQEALRLRRYTAWKNTPRLSLERLSVYKERADAALRSDEFVDVNFLIAVSVYQERAVRRYEYALSQAERTLQVSVYQSARAAALQPALVGE
jgi:hypothetical protein